MTPQQLKNSILQRAIEGRLVEQRAEEGTAKELLEEIRAEKKRLIDERKIKKNKALPPIIEEEIPFDIPDGWEWVRLGEIGDWGSGATPKRHHPEYYGGNIPWLKTGDLNDGYVSEIPETITQEGFDNSSVRLNPVGSVLMAMYGATIGKLGILTLPATTNQACCACVPFANLNSQYIFYYLMSQRTNFIKLGEGGAQPNISKEKIVNFLFPVPPLDEQHRIVAKIEELLPLISKYANAYTKLTDFNTRFPEAMKKSLLQYAIQGKLVEQRADEGTAKDLIKDIQAEKKRLIAEKKIKKSKALPPITEEEIPFDISESWEWVRLGEIGDWGSGATPKRHHPEYYGGEIPWLKTGDLNDGYISEIPETITQEGFDNSSVRLNPVGSVLMAMYGATIGKLGILAIPATTNQACCACIPFAELNPQYLFYYLMSQRANFIKLGEGGAQPNISKEKIVNFVFPMPPLVEQSRIVAKLEELLPFCDQLNK